MFRVFSLFFLVKMGHIAQSMLLKGQKVSFLQFFYCKLWVCRKIQFFLIRRRKSLINQLKIHELIDHLDPWSGVFLLF